MIEMSLIIAVRLHSQTSETHSFFLQIKLHYFHTFKAMEETMFSKYCSFLIMTLMVNFLFLKGTAATATSEVYTVGDEEEWNDGRDFVSWSQKYNFSVGDVLRMYIHIHSLLSFLYACLP
jgi:hypothetical protein